MAVELSEEIIRRRLEDAVRAAGPSSDGYAEIDLTDIPEVRDWSKAVVGKFYRPIKKSLTIRIDADVLAWLRAQGKGYQTRINGLLRQAMQNTRARP